MLLYCTQIQDEMFGFRVHVTGITLTTNTLTKSLTFKLILGRVK